MRLTVSLFLLAALACGKRQAPEESKNNPAITTGQYFTSDRTGSLTVTNTGSGGFDFALTVLTGNSTCTGQVVGRARYKNKNEWTYTDKNSGCSITIRPLDKGVIVNETGECSHGVACSFAGTYRKDS